MSKAGWLYGKRGERTDEGGKVDIELTGAGVTESGELVVLVGGATVF